MPKLLIGATVKDTISGFLLPYADYFRQLGWAVDAVATGLLDDPASAHHFDRLFDVGWQRRPADRRNLAAGRRLRAIVAERKYDLVHVHTPVASFVARLALGQAHLTGGLKIAYTAHGFHFHEQGNPLVNSVFFGLERAALRSTDALVVINDQDERLARKLAASGGTRVYYMPGIGVDLDHYSKDRIGPESIRSVREEMGLRPEGKFLLMVAAFDPGKRHSDAVQAFRLIQKPGLHLAFAGTGPEMQSMEALVRELNLAGNIHFLGERNDVPTLLAAASALILPSQREGLPRSLLEAMAMGTPAIGSSIRGIEDLLRDGSGVLVPLGDVQALADAMNSVVSNPEWAASLAARARVRVRRYAISRILELHREMYLDLLG